jgi:hypothetical protein
MIFGPPRNGRESRCHLVFNFPKHTDPHLDQFKSLDEVIWIHPIGHIQDAGSESCSQVPSLGLTDNRRGSHKR